MNQDTVKLLRECNAGIKMGESAMKRVIPKVKNENMKKALETCRATHTELGNKTHSLLKENGEDTKPPHAIASVMSDAKITVKLLMNESDSEIACLMTDGCNMVIKSLSKCINKYKNADTRAKGIAKEIIASEEHLGYGMREFL